MGADYAGQEQGIAELRALSPAGKQYLAHHFRNALMGVFAHLALAIMRPPEEAIRQISLAEEAARHLLHDLERIGC